jgi:signal transduction histidine kinase
MWSTGAGLAQPRLARSNIRLDTTITRPPAHQRDPIQLEMALLNLVTNALDAMPGGGVLSISGTVDAHRIHLEVSDNGPGLPAQVLDHLFDPWVTTKPKGQGSGLGLAIVREVVRMHGGSISARNHFPGAIFVIELPLRACHPPGRHMPRILWLTTTPRPARSSRNRSKRRTAVRVRTGPEHGAGKDGSDALICSSPITI